MTFSLPRPPQFPRTRQAFGRRSEHLARAFLEARGYVIVETNVRLPVGELDLVAHDDHVLCFVEVRSTSSMAWGGAAASITDRKRHRIIRAARWYLQRLSLLPPEIRFDVVAIQWPSGATPRIELIQGAFVVE